MGLGVELVAGQRPELEVSPAMVAFGEMMHLPSQAIDSLIQDELRANPALQRLDPVECPICRGSWQRSCPVCSRAPHRAGGAVTDRAFRSGSIDFPVPTSDADTLLSEVRVALRPVQRPIAEYLVGNLDQHGLLDQPIAAMAAELGVDDDELAAVLGVIRECGPPGLAATSVSECLQLQLERLPGVDGELRRLAGAVIESHLPALGKGQLTAIASRLGVQRSMIEEVQQLIRDRLRPRPAFNGPAGTPNRYIVPDLVIRENEIGTFTVQVVEPMRHRLRVISPHPATGGSGSGQLRDFVHAAQSLLTQLHDRWQTLQRVADCTVHRQQEFLRHGPSARKPLTRRDIATELGLHESTVSRAVAGKYALLPSRRLIPMDAFFGVSGGLDAELRRLIESEQRPLSDQEIADRLGAQGYQVARRTVAKHRIQLGIGSATQR